MADRKVVVLIGVVLVAVISGGLFYYYSGGANSVYVLHAGSLTKPVKRIDEINDKLDVRNEPHGSVTVSRLVSEGQKHPDVVAVSDYSLIPDFMMSKGRIDWYIQFARNEVVLCYTEDSKYADEIDQKNWYKILSRPDVKFGFGNPNADPGGYRAMMTVQLAELYYENSQIFDDLVGTNTAMKAPEEKDGTYKIGAVKLDQLNPSEKVSTGAMEVAVIPKLEEGSIDYMFNYRSIAKQHEFKFVELPYKVNLGKVKYASRYKKVRVKLTGGTVKKGKPIVYGITILKDAKHKEAAVDFLKYIFSEKGRKVFENMGQPPIYPPRTNKKSALPEELQDIVVEIEE
ncbi:hypothetical protein AKJ65_04360 [candidate division MSBL1 archaeon SCGC-AAA259E19]|uniref:Tungstate ABC transporter substrate-binding protein WtpA n=1 Tax=candidate division MSBL1 archaeon SCGC-AAA259E19 TaxID=1698264 RepID=A0A133UJR6_9EURY|nr:hypothetical protein AKJ65_04360 [candidate division MSBL1 archaeon SCGC-AAA259E19]